jgi:hypothetical protein
LLRIDWSSAQRIMERAVKRGLVRRNHEGIVRVGLDEKSFGRGQDYISVLSDLDKSRVLEVTPGNDTQSGQRLWQSIPPVQRAQVEAAAIHCGVGPAVTWTLTPGCSFSNATAAAFIAGAGPPGPNTRTTVAAPAVPAAPKAMSRPSNRHRDQRVCMQDYSLVASAGAALKP